METVVSILIPAIVENVFGALTEAVGLSDWLRQRLGRDPEKLAFHQALTQALTDSATHYPGRDLRYFAEILRDIGGPLLARTLQPAAPSPTADELTTVWLNHLTVDSLIHYQGEFTQFATHFLDRLQFHLENQQPLHWVTQARRERSSEEAIRRMADVVEKSIISLEDVRQEVAHLHSALATTQQNGDRLTVNTEGGSYNAGMINAQNVSMRDLTIINNNYYHNLPSSDTNKRSSNIAEHWLLQSIETLSYRLTTEVERHLEEMRNAWREGRKTDASKWLSDLRNDNTSWIALSDETKANILCFEARLRLDSGDLERSRQLVQGAISLIPTSSVARVQALIIFHESGPAPAVELLSKYDDIDSVNLRAALLLEQGNAKGSITLLDDPKFTKLTNAETLRIRALAYLLSQNVDQAQLEIQKAVELAPRWESIREASALVNYHSALSSITITEQSPLLPEPIAPIFLKSDNESRSRLRQAMRLFHELADNPEKSTKERVRLRIWEMACLANDPEQQQAAEEHCRQLLQEHPTEYTAIAWVTARGYEVGLQDSLIALEKYHQKAAANVQTILGLVLCYFGSKQYKEAVQLLENSKILFEEHQAVSIWAHWYVRSRLADNEQGNSELVIEDLKHGPYQREVGDLLLVHLAQKTGDWDPVATHFKQVYKETSDPYALLSYCKALSIQLKWDEFAEIADTLIEAVGTGNVLEFAVKGIYHAKRYDYCIELLDKYNNLFSDRRLPRELQYLRLDCQHTLGILPAAVMEAEKLFREEPSTAHLINLLSLYYELGDLKKLAVEAHLLVDRDDVLTDHLLQVAQRVQQENLELAISLWKQAYYKGLSNACVGFAISLGFNLKLDSSPEHRTLMKQVMMLSQCDGTGIIKKEVKDLLPFLKELGQHNAELQEKYQTGQLPIHHVSTMLNWPLARLYHSSENYTDEIGQRFPIFIRHGGKQLLAGFPDTAPNWRLNLDVTAVLLAEHLGVLRKVEAIYAPLRIPANLILALAQMRDALLHHQPSRLEAISDVLNYVDQNRILTIVVNPLLDDIDDLSQELRVEQIALLKEAISSNGYVVDFLPVTKKDLSGEQVTLPESLSNHLVNIRALIQVLWEEGNFDDDEYADALDRLGTEGEKVASVMQPVVGAKLYCNEVIVELLTEANLLPLLLEHFQVILTSNTVRSMRTALRFNAQNLEIIKWLDNLRNRISTSVSKGIYEIIPSSPILQDADKRDMPTHAAERCILSLLSFDIIEKDVLWIDDRYISAYLHRDGAPIIGINEILKALVASGELQEKKYYNKLIALRAANIHFIPLHKEEILYHLKMARITNGKLIETNALKLVRRHIAMSLLYGHFLQHSQLPDKVPNATGEVAYITELSRTIADTIKTVWVEFHQKEDECIAHAEWLLSSLYLDLSTTRRLVWTSPEQNDLYLMGMSLTHLLQCGFELFDLDDSDFLTKRYYEWLDQRLLSKSCENNPLLAASVANSLKDLFRSIHEGLLKKPASRTFEYEIAKGLQRYYELLPEVIRREMRQDSDFMASLGLVNLEAVVLADLIFPVNEFYKAALVAINGQSTTIKALEPNVEVTFHPVDKDDQELSEQRLSYFHPHTKEKHVIVYEELAMLSNSPTWRESVLRRNRHWFDCNAGDFEQQVALIASAEDAIRRVDTVKAWRSSSAAEFYQQLRLKIRRQDLISVDDLMPPSLDGLIRHLRLSLNMTTEQSFNSTLEQAGNDLVATEQKVLQMR